MEHIFIIGSKGIPAKYGGFETFVDKLTEKKVSDEIQYYVTCLDSDGGEYIHNEAKCIKIPVKDIGSAKAVIYDLKSLDKCIEIIENNNISEAVIYILACRIGPFMFRYKNKIKKLGIRLYVNPDGHEWKRSKWNSAIKRYWKLSEKYMVKYADLLICDSKGIENYIHDEYRYFTPKTTYISYGADLTGDSRSASDSAQEKLENWYKSFDIKSKEYYLIVGRFVPENNYYTMIKEYMKSSSQKDLVIITNLEKNSFYNKLLEDTEFNNDKRIKFVGTVYDDELLGLIRKEAYAYIHGHEVGGTNPSLLEALSTTKINLLLDVIFNKEVAEEGALYFNKGNGNLALLIDRTNSLTEEQIEKLGNCAKKRIEEHYQWENIIQNYEKLFLSRSE